MFSRFPNPTFLRRLKGILQRCIQSAFYHCLENYLAKMSKNCLCKMSYIPLYEMSFRQPCKISSRFANPKSFRRLKDILRRCLECLHKTSFRCLFADWDSSYLFRRAFFLQRTFSEELLFHSYTSFPQLHFLLIVINWVRSVPVTRTLSSGALSCVYTPNVRHLQFLIST